MIRVRYEKKKFELNFKIRRSTPFSKVFKAVCDEFQIAKKVVFIFDGDRLMDSQTPDNVDMVENDEIQVMDEQCGRQSGFGSPAHL